MVRSCPKIHFITDSSTCPLPGERVYQQSVKHDEMERSNFFNHDFSKFHCGMSNRERNDLSKKRFPFFTKVSIDLNETVSEIYEHKICYERQEKEEGATEDSSQILLSVTKLIFGQPLKKAFSDTFELGFQMFKGGYWILKPIAML